MDPLSINPIGAMLAELGGRAAHAQDTGILVRRTGTQMKIHDVHGFNARLAADELLGVGFTAVDDITRELIDCAQDELFEALGFAADGMDIRFEEMETSWGPVFIFWDGDRDCLETAREFVRANRPKSNAQPKEPM
jgi:hypothetical protein